MKLAAVADRVGSCAAARRAARRASASPAPAWSWACTASITSTVASSLTTATLETTPAVPSESRAAPRPRSSSGSHRLHHPGLARRQHDPVRRAAQAFEVVDHERSVVEHDGGEHRAVLAEAAVRREVGQAGAVQRAEGVVDVGVTPVSETASGIRRASAGTSAPPLARPGPTTSTVRPDGALGPLARGARALPTARW